MKNIVVVHNNFETVCYTNQFINKYIVVKQTKKYTILSRDKKDTYFLR